MDVLRQSNENYLNMLGKNIKDPNKKIRLLKYLIIEDVNYGKAIHNELTRSFIWIPNDQWDRIYDSNNNEEYIEFLWDNYFLVNEDFDEQNAQDQIKYNCRPNPNHENYLKSGHIHEYTIFTTMACNARCFYCYEKGRPQPPMKSETAKKVGDYIIRTAEKTGRQIELRWFGGEPLVNENAIDIICQKVKDAGFNYVSSFTSNGFLFKEEKIQKYKDLWHLTNGQITLDGTEEVYNKAKNYKNVKGLNPYQIVCKNIEMLAKNNISISIRMNMDLYNAENIKLLIKEIHDKWGNYNNINPYCYPIFDDPDKPRTDEENDKLFEKLKEIENVLDQYNYGRRGERSAGVRDTHCMIDVGYAVVISPNGDLGLCEHYSDEHFWGHIDKPDMRNTEEILKFQEYEEHLDICKDCPILPSCLRAKLCVDLRECNIWKKEWHIREAHKEIITMYNNRRFDLNQNIMCNNQNVICNNDQNTMSNNDQNNVNRPLVIDPSSFKKDKKGLAKLWENLLIFTGIY